MTKQEEIMEWTNKYLTGRFIGTPNDLPKDECQKEAKSILSYIASRGGTLEVDRELPPQNKQCLLWDLYQKGWLESQQAMRLAGYKATMPLVEK